MAVAARAACPTNYRLTSGVNRRVVLFPHGLALLAAAEARPPSAEFFVSVTDNGTPSQTECGTASASSSTMQLQPNYFLFVLIVFTEKLLRLTENRVSFI